RLSQRPVAPYHLAIDLQIIRGHPPSRETPLEDASDAGPVEAFEALRSRDRSILVVDDKAGHTVIDDLRNGTVAEGDHRCSASERRDHGEAKGSPTGYRNQKARRTAKEFGLLLLPDLADELDMRQGEERLDVLGEVSLIHPVDLGRDLDRHAGPCGDADRCVR